MIVVILAFLAWCVIAILYAIADERRVRREHHQYQTWLDENAPLFQQDNHPCNPRGYQATHGIRPGSNNGGKRNGN